MPDDAPVPSTATDVVTRRKLLVTVGAGTAIPLAGCTGGNDPGDSDDGSNNGDDSDDDGGTGDPSGSESGGCPSLPLSYESASITESSHPLTFEKPTNAELSSPMVSQEGQLISAQINYDQLNQAGKPSDAEENVRGIETFSIGLSTQESIADSVDAYLDEESDRFTVVTDEYDLSISGAEVGDSDRTGVTIIAPIEDPDGFVLQIPVRPGPAPDNVVCSEAARAATDHIVETMTLTDS